MGIESPETVTLGFSQHGVTGWNGFFQFLLRSGYGCLFLYSLPWVLSKILYLTFGTVTVACKCILIFFLQVCRSVRLFIPFLQYMQCTTAIKCRPHGGTPKQKPRAKNSLILTNNIIWRNLDVTTAKNCGRVSHPSVTKRPNLRLLYRGFFMSFHYGRAYEAAKAGCSLGCSSVNLILPGHQDSHFGSGFHTKPRNMT